LLSKIHDSIKKGDGNGKASKKRSETGISYFILRGIDGRNIFLNADDRIKFLEKIIRAKEIASYLIDNHVQFIN